MLFYFNLKFDGRIVVDHMVHFGIHLNVIFVLLV